MKSTDSFLTSEIEELSLRMPRPVAIYLCDSNNNNTRLSDQHHATDANVSTTLSRKKHHVGLKPPDTIMPRHN